ncbi:Systemic RNA interference defective protein 1 [Toxocara canis]|uniref:Systemic RNA interference defective protein 1 n=1 Tax=Toxocara canis TaxID=6265 RepID=A0A0B2W703_TOXCA|nr:Systemic RNA interference defective protein 1 [Toxocara canis]
MLVRALLVTVAFVLVSSNTTKETSTLSSKRTPSEDASSKLIPFSLREKHVVHALIGAGQRNIHTSALNDDNLIDLIRIRVRLNMKCEGYNLVQVLCDHPSDSTTFFLPTEQGVCEGVGMLGGVMREDLITDDIRRGNLSVTVTSRYSGQLNYTLIVGFLDRSQYNVELPLKKIPKNGLSTRVRTLKHQHCSAIQATAFKLTVNRSLVSSLTVVLKSEDDICAVVAVDRSTHHLIQSASSALTSSSHITFNRFATFEVPLEDMPPSFSLLVFAFGNDTICDPNAQPREFEKRKIFNVSFSIEPRRSRVMPVSLVIAFYTSFSLLFFGMLNWIYANLKKESTELLVVEIEPSVTQSPALLHLENVEGTEMSILEGATERALTEIAVSKPENEIDLHSLEGRIQQESSGSKNIPSIEHQCAVASLSMEASAVVGKDSDNTLSYFIIAPVGLQLLFTLFAERVRNTADEDSCFHNYECSMSWGPFRSFNHIISNFGYFALGATFCTFVKHRKRICGEGVSTGVQPSFSLFYGIGSALGVEALASSLYHVCPNSSAFHFDTPYIEVMCVLVMACLYGARHGVMSSRSSIALVCAVLFYHMLWGISSIQPALFVIQLIGVFVVESKIFFGSHLKFDVLHPRECVKTTCEVWRLFLRRKVRTAILAKRLILLSIIFVVNAALLLVEFFVVSSPSTHVVLYFTAVNMVLYFIYYFVNKMMCAESVPVAAFLCWSIGTLFWAMAWHFFSRSETNWRATAAQSRAMNRECTLLGFYDSHDLWHFSSSLAAFFSLIAVMLIDDDLSGTQHSQIDIF